MKNIIAIILIIVGWSEALSQDAPTLTVSGTTYDLIADRNFDVGTSIAYAEGYDAGRAETNISGAFIGTPTVTVNADGHAEFDFTTNLDNSPGLIRPFVRIILFHPENNPTGMVFNTSWSNAQTTVVGRSLAEGITSIFTHFSILVMNEHGSIAYEQNLEITF